MKTVLEGAAIAVVLTRGTIFSVLRENGPGLWRELVSCPLCAGVWIGAVLNVVEGWSTRARTPFPFALDALAVGAMAGVLALVTSLVIDALDQASS